MADVEKLVNSADCGSVIPWVRVPSFAPCKKQSRFLRNDFFIYFYYA